MVPWLLAEVVKRARKARDVSRWNALSSRAIAAVMARLQEAAVPMPPTHRAVLGRWRGCECEACASNWRIAAIQVYGVEWLEQVHREQATET